VQPRLRLETLDQLNDKNAAWLFQPWRFFLQGCPKASAISRMPRSLRIRRKSMRSQVGMVSYEGCC